MNKATRAEADNLLKNNAGKQFYHSGANVWIFSFGDGTCFHSSEKITGEKLKELEQIAEDIKNGIDPYEDDWF
jgi:hypothetical protein